VTVNFAAFACLLGSSDSDSANISKHRGTADVHDYRLRELPHAEHADASEFSTAEGLPEAPWGRLYRNLSRFVKPDRQPFLGPAAARHGAGAQ